MVLTGHQQAYKSARCGIARVGASRMHFLTSIWTLLTMPLTAWTTVR